MNRINVTWNGKRTTARFSTDLWELFVETVGCKETALEKLKTYIETEKDQDWGDSWTASDCAKVMMKADIKWNLRCLKAYERA